MQNESIGKILEELDKTRLFLAKFQESGKIPDIERDIVLAKLRNMYEFIQLIQLEETVSTVEADEPVNEASIPKSPSTIADPQPKVIEFEEEEEKQTKVEVKDEIEIMPIEITEPITVESKPEPEIQPQPHETPHKAAKPEILAEKFQSQNFLNETLAKYQNVTDLSKKMQNQPIKDIFSAINLNDKFLFIKELFNNDAALYQSTIEKLNSAGNFNDAVRYLDGNFTWDFSETMVQNFLELVRRRFL